VLHLGRHDQRLPGADLVLVDADAHHTLALDDVVHLVRSRLLAPRLALARLQTDQLAHQARPVDQPEPVRPLRREAPCPCDFDDVHDVFCTARPASGRHQVAAASAVA
jgi:hypothetical protein